MRKALVLVHVAFEHLGTLAPVLTDAGFTLEYVEASTASLTTIDPLAPDLLVIMGGPIGVYEGETYPFINAEIDLIRRRLEAQKPILGICLGAQMMAAALGARVYAGTQGKEIGWAPLSACADAERCPAIAALLQPGIQVLHWHGDTFDLPEGAQHLASSALYRNQAFAMGRYALALQFHPEVQTRELERWYVGHAAELAAARVSVTQLRQDAQRLAPLLEGAARNFWHQWLVAAGLVA